MKLGIAQIFTLIILVNLSLSHAASQAATPPADFARKQITKACAAHIMSLIEQAYSAKSQYRTPVLSTQEDQVILDSMPNLHKTKSKIAQSQVDATNPDKELAAQLDSALSSSTELLKKDMPQELGLCIEYYTALHQKCAASISKDCVSQANADADLKAKFLAFNKATEDRVLISK